MYWIGLTGNLGSGKSTVAKYLRKSGCPVIDADEMARAALVKGSPLVAPLKERFGSGLFDSNGELDRKALGEKVFASKEDLNWLESLVHPYVQTQVKQLRESLASQGHELAFYDVPLLFEKNLEGQFDKTVVVSADLESAYKRVSARDGLSDREIEARLRNQMDMGEKERLADYTIKNLGSLEDLEKAVSEFLRGLRSDLKL